MCDWLSDSRLSLGDVRVLAALDAARSSAFDPAPIPFSKSQAARATGSTARQCFRSFAKLQETGHVKAVAELGPKGERQFVVQARVALASGILGKRLFDVF